MNHEEEWSGNLYLQCLTLTSHLGLSTLYAGLRHKKEVWDQILSSLHWRVHLTIIFLTCLHRAESSQLKKLSTVSVKTLKHKELHIQVHSSVKRDQGEGNIFPSGNSILSYFKTITFTFQRNYINWIRKANLPSHQFSYVGKYISRYLGYT